MISELERSIAKYKEEYALLISEAQAIKADLAAVEAKVSRSTALLRSLGSERLRWEDTSDGFQNQMDTIAGDVLLSAAFLAYGGYFDQQMRSRLWSAWSGHMEQSGIKFRNDLARTEVKNLFELNPPPPPSITCNPAFLVWDTDLIGPRFFSIPW